MKTRRFALTESLAIVSLLCLVVVIGCTKIDYVGRSYTPTVNVDIFFSMDDVTVAHEVMGHMVAHADDIVSAEKMQKKMVDKAKKVGADAVVILGLERYQSGESTSAKETTEDTGKKTKTTTTVSTDSKYEKEITATLLKYK